MSLVLILKFLHIASGIMMIAGIVGREVTRGKARRAEDVEVVRALAALTVPFDNYLGNPGSKLVLFFGIVLALVQGWPLFGFLQGSQSNWLLVSLVLYLLTVPMVFIFFVPHRKRFEAALEAATAAGRVTDELTTALRDRVYFAARRTEEAIIGIVVFLMVTKPF